ncbi:adenylyl-sulfate kinase [Roseibium album]|uniref:adenylyl-sulfate kinase n=1 Tax=Roseibium album TaxID=311410 RepID=UPI00248FC10A|nr:adenylyl-sulfate kinase [Roseibium album]
MNAAAPLISVVSPVYRAEACVAELCRRLKAALSTISENFEIILVEDRSPDESWKAIQEESRKDPRIRGVRLARNFGQHRAITAGLDLARGDWVVVMDCDLQDPPEEIPRLYAKALEGNQIVIAQFEERAEPGLRQTISRTFWKGLSWLAGIPFDYRIGNYRIMSRRVVASFCSYREQLRLLGGITSLMGFTTDVLPVNREPRFAGETSYSFRKLLSIAAEIAMAYSDKPLRLSVMIGAFISGLSIVAGAAIIVLAMANVIEVPGWASVIVSLYLIGGMIIANLGLIGYYIGKTFDETKRRPLYIIENITDDPDVQTGELHADLSSNERVIWITGLSGAGKSTLAEALVPRMRATGTPVILLDGDALRTVFGADKTSEKNHGREARLALAMQYAHLCRTLSVQGQTVVIATISLFKEVHDWNRANLPKYFEVYLKVPIEELRRRDPKGIYRRFDAGEITHVAGLDLSVDEPAQADITLDFDPKRSAMELADEVFEVLRKRIWT